MYGYTRSASGIVHQRLHADAQQVSMRCAMHVAVSGCACSCPVADVSLLSGCLHALQKRLARETRDQDKLQKLIDKVRQARHTF